MKKLVLAIALTFAIMAQAQHELTLGLGGAKYLGDLNSFGREKNILMEHLNLSDFQASYSIAYHYNFKNYLSVGLNIYHMNVSGYDSDNENTAVGEAGFYRKQRNLSFYTPITQGTIDLRLEPFRTEERWLKGNAFFSPYLSAGIGAYKFNPKAMVGGVEYELQTLGTEGQGIAGFADKYSLTQLCIPVGLGIKYYGPKRKVALAWDFNYNITTNDYLDDVSGKYAGPAVFNANYSPAQAALIQSIADRNLSGSAYGNQDIRGNSDNTDQFITTQLKFSFFFNSDKNAYYKCCGQ